ncbi:tripartite tricarboxylate transporter substrate-binding protein [Paracraurococcus lichenis]|uniref:Tripartite tricarboxylate transporter substrate-binding protein n=1 Tax=Paracraurococcus lichenis TaxID=3064888 RepID=A0ABT9DYK6_9PROT|nr:tripartite tricarboxylate transporter substrate-binding protein [Paracraurococcus sp. LOR1-02]MDO9708974.1 tripartite tricarboxylate transporter substrate-binding protein [Paracraurococcus sp. LOR1-02]
MLRRTALISAALLAAGPAHAQGWSPTGPVRVVVPFPPGAGIYLLARLLAGAAQPGLGQPVVVENRPGGGTLVATEAMLRTPPDGQAVLMVANSFTVNPSLHQPSPYDPLRHFTPLALLTEVPHVLVAHPALAGSFAEFLEKARRPGPGLSFGSNGQGTSLHLGCEHLKLLAGLNATHVPYRGTPQVMTDLVAGRVDWMYGNLPDVLPMIRDGRLRALALAAPKRSAFLPDLPTLGELGFPAAVSDSWYGVVMPAGGRPEVAARHSAAWLGALRQPEVTAKLRDQGFDILAEGPEGFAARLRRDVAVYAEVIRVAQLQPG